MTRESPRLFWLGAGASEPAGGVLGQKLQARVLETLNARLGTGRRTYAKLGLTIYEHALRAIQDAPDSDDFEEVLTSILDPFWAQYVVDSRKPPYDSREAIRGLLFATSLAVKNSIDLERGKEVLSRFYGDVIQAHDVVLTLNYDLVVH